MLGKKGDVAVIIILIIIIIVVIVWLISLALRECRQDNDCEEDYYCDSDFTCNKIPVIEKTTTPVIINRDYSGLAKYFTFLGLAVIIGAIILKFKRSKKETGLTKKLFKRDKKEARFTETPSKPAKKISRDSAKTYVLIGAIAGTLIICLLALIVLILS
ncbi:MAG: hypothetical protein ISS25_01760 [Nanoarchaeota archaeon]|nr:hypothetical protein [DPANN group archaeon]MBL7116535.1 hypothetical protein [Nanoarchaeota archaeon]